MAIMTSGITAKTSAAGFAALNGDSAGAVTQSDAGSADRFLKLLVAQMQNQDPLNPMDNAQVTSQMAQINTVDGIARLNESVKGLNGQFAQLQALQGASLVGRDVSVKGDRLAISGRAEQTIGEGGFELASPADDVRLEILDAAGRVLSTQDLGAAGAGRHDFEWRPGAAIKEDGLRFRVVATTGATSLTAVPLMIDRVQAVSADAGKLQLELEQGGIVDYSTVIAVRASNP